MAQLPPPSLAFTVLVPATHAYAGDVLTLVQEADLPFVDQVAPPNRASLTAFSARVRPASMSAQRWWSRMEPRAAGQGG